MINKNYKNAKKNNNNIKTHHFDSKFGKGKCDAMEAV